MPLSEVELVGRFVGVVYDMTSGQPAGSDGLTTVRSGPASSGGQTSLRQWRRLRPPGLLVVHVGEQLVMLTSKGRDADHSCDGGSRRWIAAEVMPTPDRLSLATKFVVALHDVSRRNPASWRCISAIGARTGIKGDQVDWVVADAVTLGLLRRRVDDPSFVTLTNEGWAIAS